MTRPNFTYPLEWPVGWPRTKYPESNYRFNTPESRVYRNLMEELRMLGATNVTVSTNTAIRRDGLPYANQPRLTDVGVAVYFDLNRSSKCIPCDKWDRIVDNVHAVSLTIAALRGLERWGAKHMVDAAFQGFAALPAGSTSGTAWWDVLGISPSSYRSEIEKAYRDMAMSLHPDRGGTVEGWLVIQAAYEQAMEQRR